MIKFSKVWGIHFLYLEITWGQNGLRRIAASKNSKISNTLGFHYTPVYLINLKIMK